MEPKHSDHEDWDKVIKAASVDGSLMEAFRLVTNEIGEQHLAEKPANGFVAVVDQLYKRFDEVEKELNSASLLYLPELAAWLGATALRSKTKNWSIPFISNWLDKQYENFSALIVDRTWKIRYNAYWLRQILSRFDVEAAGGREGNVDWVKYGQMCKALQTNQLKVKRPAFRMIMWAIDLTAKSKVKTPAESVDPASVGVDVSKISFPPDPTTDVHASIKTTDQVFGQSVDHVPWFCCLREGRVWYWNTDCKQWKLLPPDGTPQLSPMHNWSPPKPEKIVRIYSDDINLIMFDENGVQWYTQLPDGPSNHMEWQGPLGFIPFSVPMWVKMDLEKFPDRFFCVSHREPMIGYQDTAGAWHEIGQAHAGGTTTLFRLMPDGTELTFADPWQGGDYLEHLLSPENGSIKLVSLTASQSILLAMDAAGHLHTRPYDYDQGGFNLDLPYTFHQKVEFNYLDTDDITVPKIVLPVSDWIQQPDLPAGAKPSGQLTCLVREDWTELRGNSKRELRVEALDPSGKPGYYSKPLLDKSWTFVAYPDGSARKVEPLALAASAKVPGHTKHYKAAIIPFLSADALKTKLTAEMDFTLHENKHAIKLNISGAAHEATSWDLQLLTRCPTVLPDRSTQFLGFLKVPNNLFGQLIWNKNVTEVAARLFNQTDEWKVMVTVSEDGSKVHISSYIGIETKHEERQEIDWVFIL